MLMTHHIRKTSLRTRAASLLGASLLAVASIGVSGLMATQAAYAQEEGRQFSAAAGEKVNEALTLANSGQNQAAVNILQGAITAPDLNAYERSTIYQMLGQYSYELNRASKNRNMSTCLSTLGYKPKTIAGLCRGLKNGLMPLAPKSGSILIS